MELAGTAPASDRRRQWAFAIATVILTGAGNGQLHWNFPAFTFVADSDHATLTFRDASLVTDSIDLFLDNVRVSSAAPPVIISQPLSVTVPFGGNATLSVVAVDPSPLSYQWRKSGMPISGANQSSYAVLGAQLGNDGSYDVVVSNAASSITSAPAVLTVTQAEVFTNGSFEAGTAGWTQTGNFQIWTGGGTDGAKFVAFNAGQATPNGVFSQGFKTTIGNTYELAFDAGVAGWNWNEQRLQVTVSGAGTCSRRPCRRPAYPTGNRTGLREPTRLWRTMR